MDVVRNFIHVVGITPEEQLPQKINGQLIQYSDIDTIFIPDGLPPAKSVFQIMFQVEVKSGRIIETPICRTMVVDGVKNFKIMYTADGEEDKASFAVVTTPYNTFIEMPEGQGDIDKVDVYILDAYFSLLDCRRIYGCILYLVHAGYGTGRVSETVSMSSMVLEAEPSSEDVPIESEVPAIIDDIFLGEPDIDAEYL